MKITVKSKRVDSKGKHNDRNYDTANDNHIDSDLSKQNLYWTYDHPYTRTLKELDKSLLNSELDFYSKHFKKHLDSQNKKHIKNRHYKRVKSIEQYHSGKNTKPEDEILQIGNLKKSVSPEILWDIVLDYVKRYNESKISEHCKILNVSLHVDEAVPHVHIRRVWIAEDKDGNEIINQTQALKKMNFKSPASEKKEGRYNNGKQTFTQQERNCLLKYA